MMVYESFAVILVSVIALYLLKFTMTAKYKKSANKIEGSQKNWKNIKSELTGDNPKVNEDGSKIKKTLLSVQTLRQRSQALEEKTKEFNTAEKDCEALLDPLLEEFGCKSLAVGKLTHTLLKKENKSILVQIQQVCDNVKPSEKKNSQQEIVVADGLEATRNSNDQEKHFKEHIALLSKTVLKYEKLLAQYKQDSEKKQKMLEMSNKEMENLKMALSKDSLEELRELDLHQQEKLLKQSNTSADFQQKLLVQTKNQECQTESGGSENSGERFPTNIKQCVENKLGVIKEDLKTCQNEITNFVGNYGDERYLWIKEVLTRTVQKLENMLTDKGKEIAMARNLLVEVRRLQYELEKLLM